MMANNLTHQSQSAGWVHPTQYVSGNNSLKHALQLFRASVFTPTFSQTEKQCNNNESIELYGNQGFSSVFHDSLGKNNITNINNLEGEHKKHRLFASFVDEAARYQFSAQRNCKLHEFITLLKRHCNCCFFCDTYFRWEVYFSESKICGIGFTRLISVVFNLSRSDALSMLANIVGLNFDKVFNTYYTVLAAETALPSVPYSYIPQVLWEVDGSGHVLAQLVDIVHIYGNAQQIIGAIVTYQCGDETFCLPATVGDTTLCIGRYQASAFWLNQHLIDDNPDAIILIFDDMRTAIKVSKLIADSREVSERKFIATAFLDANLEVIRKEYLQFRDVIYIPAPTKQSMAAAKLYEAKCKEALVASFSVSLIFMLHTAPEADLSHVKTDSLFLAEKEILTKAIVLDRVDRVALLMQKITDNAISYNEYFRWGCRQYLFKPHGNAAVDQDARGLYEGDYLEDLDALPAYDYSKGFDCTLLLGMITLFLGCKDQGKSLGVLSLIKQMLGKVVTYLFDLETPPAIFKARLQQLNLLEERGRRFHEFCKMAVPPTHKWVNFVLTDPHYQVESRQEILAKAAHIAVFDNVMSGGSGLSRADSDKAAGSVMGFASTLAKDGIGTIIVHHQREADSKHGSGGVAWGILAHNIVRIIGREKIIADNLGTPEVQAYAKVDGATFGLHIACCKAAPALQNTVFWYHLGLESSGWQYLCATKYTDKATGHSTIEAVLQPNADEVDSDSKQLDNLVVCADTICTTSADAFSIVEDAPAGSTGMSYNALKVLDQFTGRDVSRKDVDAFLKCSANTSRKFIEELVNAGHADILDKNTGIYRFK